MQLPGTLFRQSLKNKKKFILRKFLTFQEISYIFSKESFSDISGNENRKKNYSYFRKQNFFIFQETVTPKKKLYFRK